MFYPEFERLLSPRTADLVKGLDAYLHGLSAEARDSINPRIVAQRTGAPLKDVVLLLEQAVDRGILRRRYHIWCPITQVGLYWLDDLKDAPEFFECDQCDVGRHPLTAAVIAVRYALSALPVAVGE